MDKATRNNIQRATQRARRLIEDEFREQLEGTFDILLDGTVAAAPGAHLSEAEGVVREKLVAVVAHKRATGLRPADAVDAYVREAAFTALNRFVALKMLEARGLVQECVSRGEESSGFTEFSALAPGLVVLADKGYRLYIETLFDEIGREVRVLFDRRDVASLLWPRRQALHDLLAILNAADLASVWGEDETIGWVYQYFNGDDERRRMREESQAPRNSRELAVRNQFFTPRYVVQFLTDNTLGRTWYEMMRGETKLRDLDYLVRRPTEVFLAEEEGAPEQGDDTDLTPEERAEQPVYVAFRARKDPRDLRILDPACGSGHFLLYAFDLLLTVYEEAWADSVAAPHAATGRTLREDYAELTGLRRAAPELILRHNLHGIDIDPRAAQIAALALWMRAQRAFNEFGLSRSDRPAIARTNIIVAEPMPGDTALVEEFAGTIEPPLLGTLFKTMVEEMELAGELGSLLKIEAAIADAVRRARREYVAYRKAQKQSYLPGLEPERPQGELDFSGIDDERFFEEAEERIVDALERFAESAAGAVGVRRRLFAGDAAQGVAFIHLARHRFDVILMNPPFGESAVPAKDYMRGVYPDSAQDIFQAFVERSLTEFGDIVRVGVLSARTGFFMGNSESWRTGVVWRHDLELFADLGLGVLDEALVEAAAYVLASGSRQGRVPAIATRHLETREKEESLHRTVVGIREARIASLEVHFPPMRVIHQLPGGVFAYWAPPHFLQRFVAGHGFDTVVAPVRQGVATADDFRFVRLRWEVPSSELGQEHRWHLFSKGGEYSPPYDDIHLVVDWANDGRALRAFDRAYVRNDRYYHLPGITYTVRTASAFAAKVLPEGCIFSHNAQSWFHEDKDLLLASALFFLARAPQAYLELAVGGGDVSTSGSAARRYTTAVVHSIPAASLITLREDVASGGFREVLHAKADEMSSDETSLFFSGLPVQDATRLAEVSQHAARRRQKEITSALRATSELDQRVSSALELTADERRFVEAEIGPHPCDYPRGRQDSSTIADLLTLGDEELVQKGSAAVGAKRWITKKSYFVDRRTELICHIERCAPEAVLDVVTSGSVPADGVAKEFVSHLVGVAFGRWSADGYGCDAASEAFKDAPFRPLSMPPAAATAIAGTGVFVGDGGHPSDLVHACREALGQCWPSCQADQVWTEIERVCGRGDDPIRTWLRSGFFGYHISRYSKSRRKAPIYWQLATPSASYSVWLYYHRLTRDTFFKILNDYVTPKLQHEERKLTQFQQEAGPTPSRSQRKEIDDQETFVEELRAFKTEVARVAPLWNPNLNDGVIINFAPLWRLVPHHRAWQKECKKVWKKLVAGEYDWAHLAMHLWPERVVPKCAEDRSLAIAHDLEEVFWAEDDDGKWHRREVEQDEVEQLVENRTSAAVKAALNDLLSSPTPNGGSRRKRSSRGSTKRRDRASAPAERAQSTSSRGTNHSVDEQTLSAVKDAIASIAGGASKGDVLATTGLSSGDWNRAIALLLERGDVSRSGQRRGARYHVGGSGGDSA